MAYPVTPAIRFLRGHGIAFEPYLFPYVEKGGTKHSSEALGVSEHAVIKTLVFEDEAANPLVVLMHGDRKVSTKQLARTLGVKAITPCAPKTADRHSGYLVGGTSPFGLRTPMPIYAERSIFSLDKIYINGGKRGFLIAIAPAVLSSLLAAVAVDVAVAEG